MDRSDKVLVLLLIVALIAALILAVGRADIETANRAVEIVLDADDARQIAASAGLPLAEFLSRLREAGASALAVREMTVEQLAAAGRIVVPVADDQATTLTIPDGGFGIRLGGALQARLPRARVEVAVIAQGPALLTCGLAMDQLAPVPVGLRREDLAAARAANIRVVARPVNFPAASPEAIQAAAVEAAAAGARLVVFDADEVLGNDGLLPHTARALRDHDLLFGLVELAGQRGEQALAARLASRIVRVHSISDADMQTMVPRIAVPRYARAVRERNIRACYLRLITRPQPDPVGANIRYVGQVAEAVRAEGFRIGPPAPFSAPPDWPPRWLRQLTLLALPAGLILLLRRLAPLGHLGTWLLFLAAILLGVALGTARRPLVVPVAGLAAACIFPSLGLTAALQWARRPGHRPPAFRLLGTTLGGLALASLLSLAGGLLIVGLFTPLPYLAGVEQFRGVKLAHLVPLAVALLVVTADLPGWRESRARWWIRLRLRLTHLLGRPVLVAEALVILAALAALAFAVMRTGNQPLIAPSGAEVEARNMLESLLGIRPRTKEFFLGHPALMLAIALALRGRRTWLPLVALFGAIGQVSLINTFCHLHTPLWVTLLRVAHGLWIGALVGLLVVLMWRLLLDRPPRPAAS